MNTKLFVRVEAILKEEHFTHITKYSSAHSATLCANKGAERLVLHVTDRDEMPQQAAANQDVPAASEIRVSATLPGFRPELATQVGQRLGQGGALRKARRR